MVIRSHYERLCRAVILEFPQNRCLILSISLYQYQITQLLYTRYLIPDTAASCVAPPPSDKTVTRTNPSSYTIRTQVNTFLAGGVASNQ